MDKENGIKKSYEAAERQVSNWGSLAHNFLVKYIKTHSEFMIEEVRAASAKEIPQPLSARSWGMVVLKAAKEGLIYKVGYSKTKSRKSHNTPATLWAVKNK